MAKKIVFSVRAEKQRLSILEYYFNETGSKEIPSKIYHQFNRVINIIQRFPDSGKMLSKSRRGFIKSHYKIVYRIEPESIIILYIWDMRQNPKNLPL